MLTGPRPKHRAVMAGLLSCPLRRKHIFANWTPLEISSFEAAICVVGKQFHRIARVVDTKSTADVIGFYYYWKKTTHGKIWKRDFNAAE